MPLRLVRGTVILIFVIVPLVIIGFTVGVYIVQERHNRAISEQSHALQVLDHIDEARVILHEERGEILSSRNIPLNKIQLQTLGHLFRVNLAEQILQMRVPANIQLQHEILSAHDQYLTAALALPAQPEAVQILTVQAQASRVATLLDTLRVRHSADLKTITTTEQRQRILSRIILVVANTAVFILVGIGFLLMQRVNRQQTQLQVLQATDQLRNELVSFAAHELRNPATTITSGVWLLQQTTLDPETKQQALDSMAESAAALVRLVMNLLNMGRVEEGKLHLHREPISLPVLINGLIEEISTYQRDLPARSSLEIPDVQVYVDAEYLRLALANILDNALKHSPPASLITIMGKSSSQEILLHFHNEGPGIPSTILDHIFEKYETYAEGASGRHGIGLGLYMTRLLVEAHSGRIWAESKPGEGVTISLALPLAIQES